MQFPITSLIHSTWMKPRYLAREPATSKTSVSHTNQDVTVIAAAASVNLSAVCLIAHSAYSESVSWVAWPIGEASRAETKFCVWFLWGNGNELRGLRAKSIWGCAGVMRAFTLLCGHCGTDCKWMCDLQKRD